MADGYDLDLRNSGSGWTGTFANMVALAVREIIENGSLPWTVEATLYDGTVLTGDIAEWTDVVTFTITEPNELPRIVEIDDLIRFRA
ncbi:hypothetical protein FHT44_005083 [Mycolicibacterium sp. BK634]|uniref:hypothetical protein n=1 Tax=Mycolicibacterium sp. BK634 TaxID=2587099 RepID=UPI001621AB90|nr:hypothetical protein [Mycolicibacterium sp. BK634]MBB3752571.1 hypothetical protein [Mycolicibacterium sp. BK634]